MARTGRVAGGRPTVPGMNHGPCVQSVEKRCRCRTRGGYLLCSRFSAVLRIHVPTIFSQVFISPGCSDARAQLAVSEGRLRRWSVG